MTKKYGKLNTSVYLWYYGHWFFWGEGGFYLRHTVLYVYHNYDINMQIRKKSYNYHYILKTNAWLLQSCGT